MAKPSPQQRTWCAYVRVSKVGGCEGDSFHSPDEQEQAIRRSTSEPVTEVFTDLDVSGGVWVRQGLDAALAWLREAPDQRGMVVYDIDRLGRDLIESLTLVRRLADEGLGVRVLADDVDTRTETGMMRWGVLMTVAEAQRLKIGARWRSVQQRRTESGLPSGGPVRFGYRSIEGERVTEPDPVTGPVLREMYNRYTSGAGFASLVQDLNTRGVTTTRGTRFAVPSLIRLLDSGFGAGLLIQGKGDRITYLPGAHEPVISADEWDEYRRARNRRRQEPPKRRTARWHLAGLVRCGECGSSMNVNSYSAAKSQAVCSRYKSSRDCAGSWVNRPALEHRVALWLGGHLDELASSAWTDTERDDQRHALDAQVRSQEAELATHDGSLTRLATGWATGILDDEAYRLARADLEAERDATRATLDELKAERDALLPVDADAAERLIAATDNMTAGEWNGLLKRVIRRVVIQPGSIVIEPVTGEAVTLPKPFTRRDPDAQTRDAAGRFT